MNALKLYIPTKWEKLNQRQLLFMANLYVWNHGEADFLTKSFLFLSGLKLAAKNAAVESENPEDAAHWYIHHSKKHPFIIGDEVIASMTEKCRFLLEIGEIRPVKWIKMAKARHFRLYNACFEEYLMAENYYFAYVKTQDKQHLNNLAAVLYRRPWQRWDAEKIQKRAKKFENIPDDLRNSVFMWYVGFRGYIPTRCPALFSGTGSGNVEIRSYINGLVHALNGGDITRNNELMKQPLWYALDELEQRSREAEDLNKANAK